MTKSTSPIQRASSPNVIYYLLENSFKVLQHLPLVMEGAPCSMPQLLDANVSPTDDIVPESISQIKAFGLSSSPSWQQCELGKGRTQLDVRLT